MPAARRSTIGGSGDRKAEIRRLLRLLEVVWGNDNRFACDTYGDSVIFRKLRERLGALREALDVLDGSELRRFMAARHVNPADAARVFGDVGAGRGRA